MSLTDVFAMLVTDHTLRTVSLGSGLVGVVSGSLGCYAYLRKQGMMGAIVAHSSLFGITVAFLLGSLIGGRVAPIQFALPGAVFGGVLSMALVSLIVHSTSIKTDTAMGIALALLFGGGVFLLRIIQSLALPGHRGLRDYLFGQAATMTIADLATIVGFSAIGLTVVVLMWKEFKLHTFDSGFAASIGYPMHRLDQLLLATIVLGVVVGLRTVGVILMVSLLVCPAAAARQWTRRLGSMMVLAALFGMFSGVVGAVVSAVVRNLPTGPVISLVATTCVLVSLVAAPRRGLVAGALRRAANRRRFGVMPPGPDMQNRASAEGERP